MESNHISSDYTPSDFLQKLLGKQYNSQSTLPDVKSYNSITINSDPAIQDNITDKVMSPKSTSIKRIYFQSVSNVQSPRQVQKENYIVHIQNKKNIQIKQSSRKNSIKQQSYQFQTTKDQNPQSFHPNKKQNITQTSTIKFQQQLMLKKTQLFLKTALNGKISPLQVDTITQYLQKGFQNPYEFDKMIDSFNSKKEDQNLSKTNSLKQPKKSNLLQKNRSKSTTYLKITSKVRIVRSQQKYKDNKKSKKQKNQQVKQAKQTILKQIKQLKQLVFLNQKSLKLSKKISMM